MGLFSSFLSKLGIGKKAEAAEAEPQEAAPAAEAAAAEAAAEQPAAEGAAPAEAVEAVDVVAVCEELAAKYPGKLNWKTSIADLMRLLGIDPSLANRKALAVELGCPEELIGGDYSQMNVWLHKEVMKKLAENGGKVPAELLD